MTFPWLCPAQFYVFWCDFLTRFLSCTNQQMESLPPFLFLICSRDMTDKRIWKDTKSTITCLKNRIGTGAGFPFVCTCGSNTTFKFHIETRKIERGIALIIMPLVLITTCLMYRNRFLVTSRDGSRIEQCNRYRSSPCVFRTVYTNFHLDRERPFLELAYRFVGQKCRQKLAFFIFLGTCRRVRVGFLKLFGPAYALIKPRSVFPICKS